jgi:hypothetical protein
MRRGYPVVVISLSCSVSAKRLLVLADLNEMLDDLVAGACRSRWRQKVRRHGCLLGARKYVEAAALARHSRVRGIVSVPNNWGFRGARMNAFQAHRLSISVYPLPVPMLAQGGRLAGRSSVSPQVAGARWDSATALARREKARSGHAKRLRSAPEAGLLVNSKEFTFQIGQLRNGFQAKSNPFFARSQSNAKKNGLETV